MFSKDNALDSKIIELDLKIEKLNYVKAAQIDEEKSLIAKFGEGATKSGATLKGIFEKAIEKKEKKKNNCQDPYSSSNLKKKTHNSIDLNLKIS